MQRLVSQPPLGQRRSLRQLAVQWAGQPLTLRQWLHGQYQWPHQVRHSLRRYQPEHIIYQMLGHLETPNMHEAHRVEWVQNR